MADDYNIYKKCSSCDGTGTITINDQPHDLGPPQEITCPDCNGDGQVYWGQMLEQEEE